MSGEEIMFCYLGAVGAILVLNVVQWRFSRSRLNGLFTILVSISFAQALFYRVFSDNVPLTQAAYTAIHVLVRGSIKIIYGQLLYHLFDGAAWPTRLKQVFWWGRLGLWLYVLTDVLILLLTGEAWYRSPEAEFMSGLYWCLLLAISLAGMWIASKQQGVVSRLFIMGSVFMLVSETNLLFYATTHTWTLPPNQFSINLQQQILGVVRTLELLSFSLCLVFRQRQLAVAQAVGQARLEEQLVQERLKAELVQRRLEQEKTDVQLRALQAQVNPHFLFNSLNSLSALIDDDPERAGQFVNELSVVYRYLLKANDELLTTLASELDFIQSYYQLLKTRYGNGLDLSIQVKAEYQMALIPPLTLQLLVENAVKHNVISSKRPLCVTIFADETGHLVVRYTLQPKKTRVLSNGVGLSTIATQFQRLQQPAPTIDDQDGFFTVSVPLINPSVLTESAPLP